ncbi:MAG TPA: hypothetical protein DCZ72_02410 [Armatimonadetes bacterium]|nr:hypothetical protein [Armatimonadota bacterium]
MGHAHRWLLVAGVALCGLAASGQVEDPEPLEIVPEYTAVIATNGGLWPRIHRREGELFVFAFASPSHTTAPGDVGCWVSGDQGKTWTQRAIAIPRPAPDANYCDGCSGLTANGDLLVMSGGWADAANQAERRQMIPPAIYRSSDGGHTWAPGGYIPPVLAAGLVPRPYGKIVQAADGTLRTAVYGCGLKGPSVHDAWLLVSDDNGASWRPSALIAERINEGDLLELGLGEWLFVGREMGDPDSGQRLFRSLDDGQTWTDEGQITGDRQKPGDLIHLSDGRILLTWGHRGRHEVWAKASADGGHTWGRPWKVFATNPGDMGYPATIELADGLLLTAFYAANSPLHEGYHAGLVAWRPPAP